MLLYRQRRIVLLVGYRTHKQLPFQLSAHLFFGQSQQERQSSALLLESPISSDRQLLCGCTCSFEGSFALPRACRRSTGWPYRADADSAQWTVLLLKLEMWTDAVANSRSPTRPTTKLNAEETRSTGTGSSTRELNPAYY